MEHLQKSADVCFPYWLAGKKWSSHLGMTGIYTCKSRRIHKKSETKYANELYCHSTVQLGQLWQILFPDVLGNLEKDPNRFLLWYRFWSIPQALSLPYAPASIGLITFLETNMLHLKNDGWKTIFLLGRFILRDELLVLGKVTIFVHHVLLPEMLINSIEIQAKLLASNKHRTTWGQLGTATDSGVRPCWSDWLLSTYVVSWVETPQ